MDEQLWIFIDDRGLSRALEEIWIPHIGADLVWVTESAPDEEVELSNGTVPILEVSPADIAALSIEEADTQGRVFAVFDSLASLMEAATFGLQPHRVIVVSYRPEDGDRVAPNVQFGPKDHSLISRLVAKGFTFFIQPIPNVTARPWPSPDARPHATAG